MKKVFQTIVDKDIGNCMQAAIASLLDLSLEEVPNFIEKEIEGRSYYGTLHGYLTKLGYDACTISKSRHESTEFLKKVAKFDGGVNGYLYVGVQSQTFKECTHCVIADLDLNIVHDPNPNGKALNLTPDDIIDILVMHPMIIGKTGKLFTREDWDNTTEEERDLNTHRANE